MWKFLNLFGIIKETKKEDNKVDLNNIKQKDIQSKLELIIKEKKVDFMCSICSQSDFTIVEGFINETLQKDFKTMQFGGSSLPMVAVVCNTCGNTYYLNLNILMKYGE